MIGRWADRRAVARWSDAATRAEALDAEALRALRLRGRALRREIDRVIDIAGARLAQPVAGADPVAAPLHADWAWRPSPWLRAMAPQGRAGIATRTPVGPEVVLFHDCRDSEVTLRQVRNAEGPGAPLGLSVDVLGFDGSFLSFAVELPDAAVTGLSLRHIVRLDAMLRTERPIEIFARLNIQHGPNTEQIVRELRPEGGCATSEFDLGHARMNERRVSRAWIDIIFERPAWNEIVIADLTFARRLRAET